MWLYKTETMSVKETDSCCFGVGSTFVAKLYIVNGNYINQGTYVMLCIKIMLTSTKVFKVN